MILCLCQGVSDRTVRLTIAQGASSVDDVGDRCGAGTDCGACRQTIEELVEGAACSRAAACAEGAAMYSRRRDGSAGTHGSMGAGEVAAGP